VTVKASWKNMARLKNKLRRLPAEVLDDLVPTLEASAQIVADDIARDMRGPKTGKVYRIRGRLHQSSGAGESPAVFRGRLIDSIKVERQGKDVRLRVTGVQAMALEFGSVRSAARPFLFPALKRNRPKINETIKQKTRASLKKLAAKRGHG